MGTHPTHVHPLDDLTPEHRRCAAIPGRGTWPTRPPEYPQVTGRGQLGHRHQVAGSHLQTCRGGVLVDRLASRVTSIVAADEDRPRSSRAALRYQRGRLLRRSARSPVAVTPQNPLRGIAADPITPAAVRTLPAARCAPRSPADSADRSSRPLSHNKGEAAMNQNAVARSPRSGTEPTNVLRAMSPRASRYRPAPTPAWATPSTCSHQPGERRSTPATYLSDRAPRPVRVRHEDRLRRHGSVVPQRGGPYDGRPGSALGRGADLWADEFTVRARPRRAWRRR